MARDCETTVLQRGFDEETIRKIWGENTLPVMTEVERVASASEGPRP
jgi:microsomal dipeptidase-like Zn-dependent dipeptidase